MQSTRYPFEDFDESQEVITPQPPASPVPDQQTEKPAPSAANENPEPAEPQKTVTQETLEQAKKVAFEEGKTAGLMEGKAAATEQANAAQEQINKKILALSESLNIQLATLSDQIEKNDLKQLIPLIHTLALNIAKKITAETVKEETSKEIEAQIDHTMSVMFDLPSLTIYAHPNMEQALKEKVDALAVKNSFRGKLLVLSDPALDETDCRLDWKDGFSEVSKKELWKNVEQVLGVGTPPEGSDQAEPPADIPISPESA